MSKIGQVIEMRVKEAAAESATKVEAGAMQELHQLARDMSKIKDQVGDQMDEMMRQVRMLNSPKPKPRPRPPVPMRERPVVLLQIAVVLLIVLMIGALIFVSWPASKMVCQPSKKPGVLICQQL